MNKAKLKKLLIFGVLLQGCVGAGAANNAVVSLVSIPFKIVGTAIAAAIGAAAGMGVMPF